MRRRAISHLAVAAVLVAGCDSAREDTEQGTLEVPRRDLTLRQLPADPTTVASPVEVPRTKPERLAGRPGQVRLPVAGSTSRRETLDTAPISGATPPVAAEITADPPASAPEPPSNSRELAPGQTITIIPASNGPSVAAEPGDEAPSRAGRAIMRGHGGTCRPRPRGAL